MSIRWLFVLITAMVVAALLACSLPINIGEKELVETTPFPVEVSTEALAEPPATAEAAEALPTATDVPAPPLAEPAMDEPMPEMSPVDAWALWQGATHLRGANIHQRRVYPEVDGLEFFGPGPVGPPYTQESFNKLADLGANYVNISHPGLFSEEPPFGPDEEIAQNLDQLLEMIARADMFAVISFRTGPGRSEYTFFWDEYNTWFDESYLNDSVWGSQETQQAWAAMWRYTAERYRDNPVVVGYDLMVEPNSNEVGSSVIDDMLNVWEPEAFHSQYGGTLYDWNQMFPPIIDAIREVDSMTPVLVGGNGWGGLDWLPYIDVVDDPYVVYTVHQYTPSAYAFQGPGGDMISYPGTYDLDRDGASDSFDQVWLSGYLGKIKEFWGANGYRPVVVNEFGLYRWVPGAASFMDDEMAIFEQLGVNYALWYWTPDWDPLLDKQSQFRFTYGEDPDNRTDVPSDLLDVITRYWKLNYVKPSHPLPEL
jgi:hypothetical protein